MIVGYYTHFKALPKDEGKHFTLCHKATGPIVEIGEYPTCPICHRRARPNKNYILQVMRDGDMDDPWGTAMAWGFAVAECLTVLGADVPEELEFRPSPFVAVESHETYEPDSYEHKVVWEYLGPDTGLTMSRIDDVKFAGRCLARYLDWCKAAGRDY